MKSSIDEQNLRKRQATSENKKSLDTSDNHQSTTGYRNDSLTETSTYQTLFENLSSERSNSLYQSTFSTSEHKFDQSQSVLEHDVSRNDTGVSSFSNHESDSPCKPHTFCDTIREEVQELKLLAHAHLPDWLKDNDFLHSNHRPPIPCIVTCFKTVFSWHSETVNIWTHLIGSLVLVAITLWFFFRPSHVPYTWQKIAVFLAFFTSAVVCMTFSWLYHTLYCHSHRMSRLFSKLDYSGIAILILGSFVPWLYYGFYCDHSHMMLYIGSMVVLSVGCIVVSLWDKFSDPIYRPVRTATFIGLGLSGVVPFAHSVIKHGLEYTKFPYIITVASLYIAGALIYALRIPERFAPGKLDIWGHSHQIFHVLVVVAAVVHYNGIITMADDRIELGECNSY